MSKYSNFLNTQVSEANEAAVIGGADSFTSGGGGTANVTQSTFLNVTQSGTEQVTHAADATGARIVQVSKFVSGGAGVSNTSLDFDLVDEGDFIQEDSVSGTDFVDGTVILHGVEVTGVATISTLSQPAIQTFSADQYTILDDILAAPSDGTITSWRAKAGGDRDMTLVKLRVFRPTGTPGSFTWVATSSPAITVTVGQISPVQLCSIPILAGDVVGICGKYIRTNNTGDESHTVYAYTGDNSNPVSGAPDGSNLFLVLEYTMDTSVVNYPIDLSFYVTTSDNNQIPLTTIDHFNSLTVSETKPANTDARYILSLDGRSTWEKFSGVSLVSTDLASVHSGNTSTEFETGFTSLTISGTLDIAIGLSTTNSGVTPEVDLFTFNYDESGVYKMSTIGTDYNISYLSSTVTEVEKLSAGTENIKVNVII